jgi:endoribonuclease Dicer
LTTLTEITQATSLSLFVEHHGDDEFELHVKRMVLICNQHLFEKAKLLDIPAYVQTEGFSRRFWYPEINQILGKGTGKEIVASGISRKIADKSVSDVCEALIGAALLDKGLDGATQMVTILLQTPRHTQKEWADYRKRYKKPPYQLLAPSAAQLKLVADIEQSLGYRFKAPGLLMSAFTHSSHLSSWERIPCYQRLEFLGKP